MINGLSHHTTNAAGSVDYLLDSIFFDRDKNADPDLDYDDPKRQGEWRDREPKPVLLVGDPDQLVALCNSLTFKNTYTNGCLSFSLVETALIDATPGLKEKLIQEITDFAYAGVKNDDCKEIFVVQHTHTGRLELNYVIPRVHLESGKYFNPFPPNYDGRRGQGANDIFKEHNDAFVDYVCSKYGLQNPRDPQYAQEIKISKFDTAKVDKKLINDEISKLVGSGDIESRDDVVNFLKNSGGKITRMGKDYISVKYDDKSRAIRLTGGYYGEQSHAEIRAGLEAAKAKLNRTPEEFEAKYREVQEFRAAEVEKRHDLKGYAAERSDDFDKRSTAELRDYAAELKATKDSLVDYDRHSASVSSAIANNGPLVSSAEAASDCSIGAGTDADLSGPIPTGDPIIDFFAREFHKMQSKLLSEEMARSKKRWQVDPEQEKRLRQIQEWIVKLFSGVILGRNFFTGSPKPMAPVDIALARQMIVQERRELGRELKAVATVVKQRERVEPLREILKPIEPEPEAKAVEAKPAEPALPEYFSTYIEKNIVLNRTQDIDTIGNKRVLRAGWLSDKINYVRDEAQFWNKSLDAAAVERGVIEAMARQKIPAKEAFEAVLKDSAVKRGDAHYAAEVVSREYTRAQLKAENKPGLDLDTEAQKRFPELLKRAASGVDAELKAINEQARQNAEIEQQRLDDEAEKKRLALLEKRAAERLMDKDSSLTKG